jgi:hypothetical protein
LTASIEPLTANNEGYAPSMHYVGEQFAPRTTFLSRNRSASLMFQSQLHHRFQEVFADDLVPGAW